MKLFPQLRRLVLYSNLGPDECARRLLECIDIERFTPFSFSGYQGSKSFLGRVNERRFRVRQRTYGRQDVPIALSGEFLPRKRGTLVTGVFDLEPIAKIAACLIFAVGGVSAAFIVKVLLARPTISPGIAVICACTYITLALLAPNIARALSLDQERSITDFLCTALEAGEDSTAYTA